MSAHLVIVGGGQAAAQTIVSLRQLGFDGAISLVSDESFLPYQRPPLSKKYLAGELSAERLLLKPEHFYAERGVTALLGTRAAELDAARRRVRLASGDALDYDWLVLATGSQPRRGRTHEAGRGDRRSARRERRQLRAHAGRRNRGPRRRAHRRAGEPARVGRLPRQ
jgi:NADPH-dependent 2,4-dienoyl-CoA reductase/sulfur reductase-like enzyme